MIGPVYVWRESRRCALGARYPRGNRPCHESNFQDVTRLLRRVPDRPNTNSSVRQIPAAARDHPHHRLFRFAVSVHRGNNNLVSERISRRQRALLRLGSIGPLGHAPASGTVTVAVVGLPLFWLTHACPPTIYLAATILFAGGAVWIHGAGDRILDEKDSRRLVWDELVGFSIAVALVPFTWQTAAVAFVLERTLDIAKVPPARWIERNVPGGWGVVGDDLIAGAYTCAVLHLLLRFTPTLLGVNI